MATHALGRHHRPRTGAVKEGVAMRLMEAHEVHDGWRRPAAATWSSSDRNLPDEPALRTWLQRRSVADLIAALPPDCCEVFSLRTVEGLSQRDIAVRMAIPESRVQEHIARALQALMSAFRAGCRKGEA
jgi:RNA polymerase sigma factor (sigma-70 family)